MTELTDRESALWELALADSARHGIGSDDVHLEVANDDAESPVDAQPVIYWPRGASIDAKQLPLNGEQVAALRASRKPHRIAVRADPADAALLGFLGWGLELAHQFQTMPNVSQFAWTALDAGLSRIYSARPGGGVMHNVMPAVRDANLAAADLVSRTQGEQFGQFYGPHGTLFRADADFGGAVTLAQRVVVFAAMHEPWLNEATGSASRTAEFVAEVNHDAAGWWKTLLENDLIAHVQGVIPFLAPTDAELEQARPAVAEPWRPLSHLLERTTRYGVDLLGPGGWGAT